MKRFLACAALSCLILPARAQEAGKPSAADILARVRPSVVKLNVMDARKQKSSGSGVFLTANGQILTCYHVIANAKTVVAQLADGSTAKVTGVVAFSAAQDWAVVQSDARNAVPAPRGKPSALRQGDRIYTLGAPLGLNLTASDGMVSSIREVEGVGLYLQITAPISPGSSGGPVLNTDGEVVGIAAFRFPQGENLNFAVAISNVEAGWTGTETGRPFTPVAPEARETAPAKKPTPNAAEVSRLYAQGVTALPSADAPESARITACRRALTYFGKANLLWPNDPDILFQVAYCYAVMGETERAISEYRAVIQLKPNIVEAHVNLGGALRNTGRYDEAIAEFRVALRLKPNYAVARYNLGAALYKAGRTDEAIAELYESIRVDPDSADSHFCLGLIFSNVGRSSDSIAEYRKAILIRPDDEKAHNSLGNALHRIGRADEAIAAFRRAIRINPQNASSHSNLGVALGDTGSTADAIAELREAIRIEPSFADAHYNLSVPLV